MTVLIILIELILKTVIVVLSSTIIIVFSPDLRLIMWPRYFVPLGVDKASMFIKKICSLYFKALRKNMSVPKCSFVYGSFNDGSHVFTL